MLQQLELEIAGGGDWTEDRIVKDCLETFYNNKTLVLRNPDATRPWQHVIEPLIGYLILIQNFVQTKEPNLKDHGILAQA